MLPRRLLPTTFAVTVLIVAGALTQEGDEPYDPAAPDADPFEVPEVEEVVEREQQADEQVEEVMQEYGYDEQEYNELSEMVAQDRQLSEELNELVSKLIGQQPLP